MPRRLVDRPHFFNSASGTRSNPTFFRPCGPRRADGGRNSVRPEAIAKADDARRATRHAALWATKAQSRRPGLRGMKPSGLMWPAKGLPLCHASNAHQKTRCAAQLCGGHTRRDTDTDTKTHGARSQAHAQSHAPHNVSLASLVVGNPTPSVRSAKRGRIRSHKPTCVVRK